MNKLPDPVPAKTKEFLEWEQAGKPTFQHFNSREELEVHLKWVEEHKHELPF